MQEKLNKMFGLFKKKKKVPQRVERELWYELVAEFRSWDSRWQDYLDNTRDRKPKSKDIFIDKMIKDFKLSEREKKHT